LGLQEQAPFKRLKPVPLTLAEQLLLSSSIHKSLPQGELE
jgi:hypothetical protein